jgi:histone H3/H4
LQGWNVGSYSTSIDGFERSLADYQRIYKERRAEEFVHTNVSRVLFDTLDYALEPWDSAPIVFAEGLPSIGKTTAAEAWAEQHLGEARFISLRALNSKSTFMRTLCESLRLPIARSASGATAMQGRVEHFLHETKIMLVIDRAEHLFPKGKGNAHPALLDYLSTLQDDGIPIALITWGQVFGERLKAIQESTSWASHTFIGRISRCASLGTPTVEDCAAVTRKALPEACAIGVRLISKVACESRRYLQGVSDLASEARRIAKREGRAQVTLKDIQTATEQRINSEVMMRRMFSGAAPRRPVAPQSDAQPIPARQAQLPAPAENAREAFARNITGSGAGVSADRARPLASALEIQK